jgi:hypothetical protein
MAASFTYETRGTSFNHECWRHYLLLGGSSRIAKAGYFTIPAGFTGSMSVLVPGTGHPNAVIFFGTLGTISTVYDHLVEHVGVAVRAATTPFAVTQWGGGVGGGYLSAGYPRRSIWSATRALLATNEVNTDLEGSVTSLNSGSPGGFTINITNGPTVAADVVYLCLEGGGNYACGTFSGGASLGVQSVGVPFVPSAVFFSWAQQTALDTGSGNCRMGYGGLDADSQYVAWYGGSSGDAHTDNALRHGRCISHMLDASAAGPFDPEPLSEATGLLTGSGFDLDWTEVDGSNRYGSWFAVDGDAEIGAWLYNHTAQFQVASVPTTYAGKGFIFFMNDQGNSRTSGAGYVGLEHNPPQPCTLGGTLSLGFCGDDLSDQNTQRCIGIQDVNRGAGPGGPIQTMHRIQSQHAFGAMTGVEQVLAGNLLSNGGVITAVEEELAFRPQIYRRVIARGAWLRALTTATTNSYQDVIDAHATYADVKIDYASYDEMAVG